MAEKTIQGKKCPKCFSFVKDSLTACPVCGHGMNQKVPQDQETLLENQQKEIPTIPVGKIAPFGNTILCSKCGTENATDFKFCKICKHPLTEQSEKFLTDTHKPANIYISIEWIRHPDKKKAESSLPLRELAPVFSGITRWKDYGFFVYRMQERYEILVKKLTSASGSILFKKCSEIFILESGREFYLGAIKFQLLGDFSDDTDNKTVVKSDKTILKGPGEKPKPHFFEGKPRIKIERLNSKRELVEISDTFKMGRSQIAEFFGVQEDELRQSGISKEHIIVTPYRGGQWLLNPLPDKPVFLEIKDTPVVIRQGETIRWVSDGHLEECELFIHKVGG
jgi:hypothetical protein